MDNEFGPADIIAMKALLARVVRGEDDKARAAEERRAADAKFQDAEQRRASAFSAFSAFGFSASDKEIWTKVRAAMGDRAWFDAFVLGGRHVAVEEPPPAEEEESNADGDGASAAIEQIASDSEKEAEGELASGDQPTIRDIVLAQLVEAGPAGAKAAAIRDFILRAYDKTVHDKTVGMTLYRLSKDGLARREGRTWFSARSDDQTENPGGDTPGSDTDQSEKEDN